MQRFIAVFKKGWSDDRRRCPQFVKPFWNYSDELWLMEGLVFKGERIVIPSSLRKDMLKLIHRGYMGMAKWKRIELCFGLKLSSLHWTPEFQSQVTNDRTRANWSSRANCHYWFVWTWKLTLSDHSWLLQKSMPTTTSSAVINKIKAIFARYGIPEKVVSDNCPQFSAQ